MVFWIPSQIGFFKTNETSENLKEYLLMKTKLRNKTLAILVVILGTTISNAQQIIPAQKDSLAELSHKFNHQETENVVGINYFIDSQILDTKKKVQVYLPPNYKDSGKKYPVLYLLDGQRFFLYAVSLSQSFKQFQLTPEFIVVGIDTDYPERFQLLGEKKETFINFLRTEVIASINHKFRTNDENLFFGWEYGAGLVFNTMLADPKLFDAYIMASAYPIMNAIDAIETKNEIHTTLFFSTSPDEYEVKNSALKLEALLSQKNIEGLQWSLLNLDIEKHRSTGYPTLYHGLRNYFKYYQEFEANNIEKFINSGGLDYAKYYSEERARRHGFSPELSLWSKFTIIRSAMRAKDFYHFELLLNTLNKQEIIDGLISDNRNYAVFNFAEFYEKNKRFKEAIALYDILLEKIPDSERLKNRRENANNALKRI